MILHWSLPHLFPAMFLRWDSHVCVSTFRIVKPITNAVLVSSVLKALATVSALNHHSIKCQSIIRKPVRIVLLRFLVTAARRMLIVAILSRNAMRTHAVYCALIHQLDIPLIIRQINQPRSLLDYPPLRQLTNHLLRLPPNLLSSLLLFLQPYLPDCRQIVQL